MPHRKSANDADSELAHDLHKYPRWAQILVGLAIFALVLGVPGFVIGTVSGNMDVFWVIAGVIGFVAVMKVTEYVVTETAKRVL